MLGEPAAVGELRADAAQDERESDRARDRGHVLARLEAHHEEGVDPGRLVGPGAGDRIVDAGDGGRARTPRDDEPGILAAREGGPHLFTAPSSTVSRRVFPTVPKGWGRSVSSMDRAATPAVSSSSTVRFTLRAFP